MSDTLIRQDLYGKKVIIKVHNLYSGVIYQINAIINQQGEIFNRDSGKRIYPLTPGTADELGKIILYDQDKTDTVVEITVKAIEILRKYPEYTAKIATIVDNDDATNEEVRDILIDVLKNPIKAVNTAMFRELEAVVNDLEEEIKDREEEEQEEDDDFENELDDTLDNEEDEDDSEDNDDNESESSNDDEEESTESNKNTLNSIKQNEEDEF